MSKVTVYTCDYCGAKKEVEMSYPQGWIYAYKQDACSRACATIIEAKYNLHKGAFTPEQYAEAEKYWENLTEDENRSFWKHYTVGKGTGYYPDVDADCSYEDYQVVSMLQTEFEILHDC